MNIIEATRKTLMKLLRTDLIFPLILFLISLLRMPDVEDATVRLRPMENIIPVIVYNVLAKFSGIKNSGKIHASRKDAVKVAMNIQTVFIVPVHLEIFPFP